MLENATKYQVHTSCCLNTPNALKTNQMFIVYKILNVFHSKFVNSLLSPLPLNPHEKSHEPGYPKLYVDLTSLSLPFPLSSSEPRPIRIQMILLIFKKNVYCRTGPVQDHIQKPVVPNNTLCKRSARPNSLKHL